MEKEMIWNAMREILHGRWQDDEVWRNSLQFDLCHKTMLTYYGEKVETSLVEIRLDDEDGKERIVLTSICLLDGEECREVDDVMHLDVEEMQDVYYMMIKNI